MIDVALYKPAVGGDGRLPQERGDCYSSASPATSASGMASCWTAWVTLAAAPTTEHWELATAPPMRRLDC
jgi:hypothetical protein